MRRGARGNYAADAASLPAQKAGDEKPSPTRSSVFRKCATCARIGSDAFNGMRSAAQEIYTLRGMRPARKAGDEKAFFCLITGPGRKTESIFGHFRRINKRFTGMRKDKRISGSAYY